MKFSIDRNSLASFANSDSNKLFADIDFVITYYTKIIHPLEEDLVQGANWTWDEVNWLKHRGLDGEGILKIKTERLNTTARERNLIRSSSWSTIWEIGRAHV